jgi:uncharacterized protein
MDRFVPRDDASRVMATAILPIMASEARQRTLSVIASEAQQSLIPVIASEARQRTLSVIASEAQQSLIPVIASEARQSITYPEHKDTP